MKKVYLIAAVTAVLSGLLLFFYLNNLERSKGVKVTSEKTVNVVTVATEVPPFTPLTTETLVLTQVAASTAPASAFHNVEECVGLVSDGTLYPGEILLNPMLADMSVKAPSLSYEIPEGMRAMTVTVNASTGVAGYITAGDRIDLLYYTTSTDELTGAKSSFTKIVGDDLQVLAAGDVATETGAVYTNLTLALTNEQCREIYAYQSLCNWESEGNALCALLRNPEDSEEISHTTEIVTDIPGRDS